jgi:molybdenum ABC transporter molybdate-binding protein
MLFLKSRWAVLLAAAIQVSLGLASATEIRVMTSGAFTAAYLQLAPQFERTTGNKVITRATSMGTGRESIPNRLRRGEEADIVIMADADLDSLIQSGTVEKGSRAALARSAIGMAVRAGEPKPDISSVEGLKHTLVAAKSIAYSASVSGQYLSNELFPRLGIADQIKAKCIRVERERVGAVVARGEAEIGFQQISELLPISGIDYVGPLPPEVQRITVFSAGILSKTKHMEAAREFVAFLSSSEAVASIAKTGLEPADGAPTQTASSSFHLLEAGINDIHAALRSHQMTCRKLVELYLARISAYDKSGPALNAVQTVNPHALEQAERLDVKFGASGLIGGLHCIPVLVKDQLDTADVRTTYGSAVFNDFVPQRDATVVARLRDAGAIIIGKATMGEFASGIAGSAAGAIRNAYDPRRHASGSSGGTGSGITANLAAVGIGEDTGGSVRGPAAVSNLVGLRPTVPLVSRYGMFPAKPTTDTVGPITRSVRDAALVLDAIAGYDSHDRVTAYAVGHIPASYSSALARDGLNKARIGVIRQPLDTKTDTASEDYRKVRAVIDKAILELRELGAELVDPVAIPDINRINQAYDGNVFETEPAINDYLAEHSTAPARTLSEILLSGKVAPYRARSLINTVGKSTDDPKYAELQRIAEDTRRLVLALMADHKLDALVYATFDHQPALIPPDVMTKDPNEIARLGNNRRLSPILGFPALTVPAGFTSDGLPVGLEFMARPFGESTLFRLGYAYEQGARHRMPPTTTPRLRGEP